MVLTGIRQMEMIEVPDPKIVHDTDVLIKMDRVGVCGSDIHYYTTGKIGSQVVEYPFPVGHEGAGTVVDWNSDRCRDSTSNHTGLSATSSIRPPPIAGNINESKGE